MRDTLRHRLAVFRAFAQRAGAAVSLVGCLVLVGWVFDLPFLKSVFPGLAIMKVNTAFGLVLAGLALWGAAAEQAGLWQGHLKQGGASLAGLIGALTLSEYLAGWDLGIDQLVFQDAAARAEFPGRMSPATALNFLLVGIALLVLDHQRLLAQVLVLGAALVSLLALAGYLYGVPALYGISPYSTMALHTALGFLLLCAGMLAARPERGFAAILVNETLGGKLARRLLPAVVVAPLGLGWLRLEGERQGLYETEFGLALFAVANAVMLAVLIGWSAQKLQREETERQDAQERFRRLFDAAPDAMVLGDPQGRILLANAQVGLLFGYQPGELYGQPVEMLMPEQYRARHRGHRQRYMAEPRAWPMGKMEAYGQRKDGSEVPVEISMSPLETREGLLVICAIRDITERRQAEEKYRSIFDNAVDGIFQSAPTGRYLSANPALARMLGYESPEKLMTAITDIARQVYVDPERYTEFRQRLAVEGVVRGFEAQVCCKDGRKKWISTSARCAHGPDGTMLYCEGFAEDITARKRQELEEKLLQGVREELWKMHSADEIVRVLVDVRQTLEALEVPFWTCDLNLVEASSATPKVYWHDMTPQGKWEGVEVQSAEDAQTLLALWQAGRVAYRRDLEAEDMHRERERIQSRFGHPVRSVIDVPFSHGTLALNSDRPDAFSEEDITFLEKLAGVLSEGFHRLDDLKTLELTQVQLHQAQKMEILGQLAGGVAHDFNNLLGIISGYTETLLRDRGLDARRREFITEIQQAGERGQGLVRQLLVFSRKQKVQVGELDLNQVVRGMEKMMGRLIGPGIELSLDLAPELGRIKADVGQVEQVLMNLVVNARDAMPEGGSIVVETANTGGEGGQSQVLLAVRDTGVGMEEEVRQHIFEPFFTTKEEGKGTGLGLAVVQRIVAQAGGHIVVHSRPGQGTRFEVYWSGLEERKRSTVLVMDDEEKVVQLMALMLRGQGYEVLVATGGEEALGLCGQHLGKIDLLLADVEMPGRKGWEVAAQVKEVHPGGQVIYTSGYQHHPEVERQVREGNAGFLAKPFSAETLLHKVREVLNATADRR